MAQKTYRNPNLLRKQKEGYARVEAERVLRTSKSRVGNIRSAILSACDAPCGVRGDGSLRDEVLRCAWHQQGRLKFDHGSRIAFRELLLKAADTGDLLEAGERRYVEPLARLAVWSPCWLRDPHGWSPRSHNKGRQFASLARHLVCKYEVPPFMDHAWLGNGAGYAGDELCQQWFVHIGTGNNIRNADGLPF